MQINDNIYESKEDIDIWYYGMLNKEHTKENQHRNYIQEILQSMTNSEIMQIILDKRKELKLFPTNIPEDIPRKEQYYDFINRFWKQEFPNITIIPFTDFMRIFDKTENEKKKEIELCINRLNFELRQRDPDTKTNNTKEHLDQKKREISIVDVIQQVTWKHLDQSLSRNIPCMLPWHNDKTWSLHIYQHTNTFKCFWCQRWGSQVDFIREMKQCSVGEAIRIFLSI